MSFSILGDRALDLLYEHYDIKASSDEEFLMQYSDLTRWLVECYNNSSNISYRIISSGRLAISTFPIKNNTSHILVWDTSFWDLYERFLMAFFSFDTLISDPFIDGQKREQFWNGTTAFFLANTFRLIRNYYSTSPSDTTILNDINTYEIPSMLRLDSQSLLFIKEIISFSKEFILLHELEHLLKDWSPVVFNIDSKAFINAAKYYRDHIVDLTSIELTHIDSKSFKSIISNVISDPESYLFTEIYNDYHAFFEVLLHHNENIKDTALPFSKNISSYFFSLKLLKFFESYRSYVLKVTGKALSTAHLDREKRECKIRETAQKASSAIYERDYLVTELISISLILQAVEFGIPYQDFSRTIDTLDFSKPYTDVMEPLVNKQIKEIVAKLLLTH